MKTSSLFSNIINFFKVDIRLFLICALSGLLAGSAAPGIGWWFFAWLGFIPLIVIIGLEPSYRKAGIYAFVFGYFYHILFLWWFTGLHPLHWLGINTIQSILLTILVLLALAFYMALFVALFGFITRTLYELHWGRTLLIPLAWVLVMNVVTAKGPFALPWSMIEYTQYNIKTLIQASHIVGGIGIGYIILLYNTTVAMLILDFLTSKREQTKILNKTLITHGLSLILIAILLIALNIYGYKRIAQPTEPGNITASVLQASFPIELFRTGRLTKKTEFQTYLELIFKAPDGLLVLPEGAIATNLRKETNEKYLSILKAAASSKKSSIIMGTRDALEMGETNAVLVINPEIPTTEEMPVYNKRHLVPFGEYTPFRELLPAPIEALLSISSTSDFASDNKATTLQTNFGKLGALICYEAIFPDFARELTLNGANFLVNVSNLGWFHNNIIDEQFLAICTFRAIENDRFLLVAINNGSSAIIDPTGNIIALTPKNTKALVSAKIKAKSNITFYTLWGI
jgi:apolipoprotein N-acyltransferase